VLYIAQAFVHNKCLKIDKLDVEKLVIHCKLTTGWHFNRNTVGNVAGKGLAGMEIRNTLL